MRRVMGWIGCVLGRHDMVFKVLPGGSQLLHACARCGHLERDQRGAVVRYNRRHLLRRRQRRARGRELKKSIERGWKDDRYLDDIDRQLADLEAV